MILFEIICIYILYRIIRAVIRIITGADAREAEEAKKHPATVQSLGLNVFKEAEKEAIKNGDYDKARALHDIDKKGSSTAFYALPKEERARNFSQHYKDSTFRNEVEKQLTDEMNEKLRKQFVEQKRQEWENRPKTLTAAEAEKEAIWEKLRAEQKEENSPQ